MSDAKKKEDAKPAAPAETAPAEGAAPAKKKSPIATIGLVAGIMVAEAAVLYVLLGKTSAQPATAEAHVAGHDEAEKKETVEIELLDEKFQNMQTGKTWMWDVQIVLKVKQKNEELITPELEKRASEIKEGLAQVFRRAQHSHLVEPELITVNRQVHAFMDRLLGLDPEGHSRIERVLIPRCRGIQIEQ